MSYALNDTLWFLWNQQIVGQPAGPRDEMADCPLGGGAHLTGTTTISEDGINGVEMVFELVDCESSEEVYELAFTGTVTMAGTFNGKTDFSALTFQAPDLHAAGVLHFIDDPALDESCDMNLAQEGGGDSFELTGRRCGRPVNRSALSGTGTGTGTGGASSGGTGNTGGGDNACTCYCPNGDICTGAPGPNPCGVDADGIPEACGCPVNCP